MNIYTSKHRAAIVAAAVLPLIVGASAHAQLTISFNPFVEVARATDPSPVTYSGTITNTTGNTVGLSDFTFLNFGAMNSFQSVFDSAAPFSLGAFGSYTGAIFDLQNTDPTLPNGVYGGQFVVTDGAGHSENNATANNGAFAVSVPEPTCLAFVGIGLAALSARRRRSS